MRKINMAHTGVDRFSELEGLITDHINQEAEQETAMDAAERELRAIVNHLSEERIKKFEAEEAHRQQREEEEAHRQRCEEERISQALRRRFQRDMFILRCFGCVAIVSVLALLYIAGGMSGWLVASLSALTILYFVANIVAYFTRNRKKEKSHA